MGSFAIYAHRAIVIPHSKIKKSNEQEKNRMIEFMSISVRVYMCRERNKHRIILYRSLDLE